MLTKKLLILTVCVFLALIFIKPVFAESITINPSVITLGGEATVTIDAQNYKPYVYIYKEDSWHITTIGFACDTWADSQTCSGEKTFGFIFSSPPFSVGSYRAHFYSYTENNWLETNFEIIGEYQPSIFCGDGICNGNETCATCEGDCGECPVVSQCSDGTLYGECSITDPLYCDNGKLISKCQICPCPRIDDICQADGICVQQSELENCGDLYCSIKENCHTCEADCGCDNHYDCREDGLCEISYSFPVGSNTKADLYSQKEVFLVSDKDWKTVLPFVSATTWTDTSGNIHKHPFLIFHEEDLGMGIMRMGIGFDADSIIYFMQQYSPDKVTIIGETPQRLDNLLGIQPSFGAGLSEESIQRINPEEYIYYWQQFDTVVYVEDNYEMALLASTYASLINAPLVIKGTEGDSSDVFFGRDVICVGNVEPSDSYCKEEYNLEQLQQKYFDKTHTDKIILINPDDINMNVEENFCPKKSIHCISDLYTKISLTAPLLASAKQELLLSTHETDYQRIDDFIEQKINYFSPNYLTIMASFEAIPHSEFREETAIFGETYIFKWALDQTHYADINGDYKPDVAVGRIAGISNSDVSSYIARDLFYDSFQKTNNMKFLASSFGGVLALYTKNIASLFKEAGYNAVDVVTSLEAYDFNSDEWKVQDLIFYTDHGDEFWAGFYSYNIPYLKNSLIIIAACLTASSQDSNSFWAHAIRRGAIGFVGAVSVTAVSDVPAEFLERIYYNSQLLGDAFKDAVFYSKTEDIPSPIYPQAPLTAGVYILFGDPTLNIKPRYLLNREISVVGAGECSQTGESCFLRECCSGSKCTFLSEGKFFKCRDLPCDELCEERPPENFYCSSLKDVKGYYSKCSGGECVLKKLASVVDNCVTPSPQYQCSENTKQKKTHKGVNCAETGDTAVCQDNGWNDWTNVRDCGSTPADRKGCGVYEKWVKTHKGKGCNNGACYDNGWNEIITTPCANICRNGECTCDAIGTACLVDRACCSNLCFNFKCNNKRADGESCWINKDCVSNNCRWFKCRA